MLEWRGFLISTKLSYGVYLVQFAVFHFNIGKVRSSSHFGIIKSVVNIDRRMTLYVRTSNIYFNFFSWTQTNCFGLSSHHRSWPCSLTIHSAISKSWFLIARKWAWRRSHNWIWTRTKLLKAIRNFNNCFIIPRHKIKLKKTCHSWELFLIDIDGTLTKGKVIFRHLLNQHLYTYTHAPSINNSFEYLCKKARVSFDASFRVFVCERNAFHTTDEE